MKNNTPRGQANDLQAALAYITHFQKRVLQDAMSEASPAQLERRAQQFDAVHPHQIPFPLWAPEPLVKQAPFAMQAAYALRAKALVQREYGLGADVDAELTEYLGAAA